MLQWFPETSIARQSYPFCNNANAAVRKSVWQELRYDETLTGLEDLDWARRAQSAGHSISYVAEAPVAHVHEEPWKAILNRYRREAIAYKKIVGKEMHVSGIETFGLALGNTLGDYIQAARDRVLRSNHPDPPSAPLNSSAPGRGSVRVR